MLVDEAAEDDKKGGKKYAGKKEYPQNPYPAPSNYGPGGQQSQTAANPNLVYQNYPPHPGNQSYAPQNHQINAQQGYQGWPPSQQQYQPSEQSSPPQGQPHYSVPHTPPQGYQQGAIYG